MTKPAADSRGWTTPKGGRAYAGKVSERTFRNWLKSGLRYSRMESGQILVSYQAIDEFIAARETTERRVATLAQAIVEGLKGR